MIETNPSSSIAPKPIARISDSRLIIFGVVPEATSAWNPLTAPHAMVMNRNGKIAPGSTGPSPPGKWFTAFICSGGATMRIPAASSPIVPIFMYVLR